MPGLRRREALGDNPRLGTRLKRILPLAGPAAITLGFGLQLSSWHGERVRREAGYPGLEVLRSWGCTEGRALRWPASTETRRRLPLPQDWPRRRRDAPHLLVFVNGARIAFRTDVPGEGASGVAYYERAAGRRLELLVACSGQASCGVVEAIPEDRGLDACLARARLLERPPRLLALAVATGTAGVLAALGVRGVPHLAIASALVSLAITSAWLLLRLQRTEWAAPVLLLQAATLAALPLGRVVSRPAAALASLLDRAEDRLARVRVRWLDRAGAWATCLAAAALAAPLCLTDNAYLGDWGMPLYYVQRQLESLREGSWPSPFVHAEPYGAFYPWFAFYGGPLYALTAGLGWLLSAVVAYKLTYAWAFVMGYAGAAWWAQLGGVREPWAHSVGLLSVTSGYWLSLAYGKGSWGEFVATSALPLVLAASTAFMLSAAPGRRSCVALLVGLAFLSGTHTVTFIWGGLFVGAYLVLLPLLLARAGERIRGTLRTTAAALVGIGLNGWFLGPLLAYAGFTHVAEYSARGFGTNNPALDSFAVIFHPGRYLPPDVDIVAFVQVSVYALLWSLAAGFACFGRLERRERHAFVLAVLGLAFFLSLLTQGRAGWFWRVAPSPLRAIQYPPRLHAYLSLCVLALVILGLRSIGRSPRRRIWAAAYAGAVAVQLGLAAHQVRTAPLSFRISDLLRAAQLRSVPRDYRHDFDYTFRTRRDGTAWNSEVEARASLELDLSAIHADRARIQLPAGLEGPFATNVSFSPLIRGRGDIVLLGRTRAGLAVVDRRSRDVAPASGTIEPAWPWPRRAGVALTALSLAGALLLLRRKAPS